MDPYLPLIHAGELRLVLLCIAILAAHAVFVVEQPRQTLLFGHFRWQWFQERVCYVPCLICMHDVFIYYNGNAYNLIYMET
jgi:hypothetical protein